MHIKPSTSHLRSISTPTLTPLPTLTSRTTNIPTQPQKPFSAPKPEDATIIGPRHGHVDLNVRPRPVTARPTPRHPDRRRPDSFARTEREPGHALLSFYLRQGAAELQGLKQVIDWMVLSMTTTPTAIKAPKDLVSAIFLARALFALGMRVDAINVNRFVEDKLRKNLHPMHVKELWEQVPRDTKYVHMLVENLVRFGREDKLCKETIIYIRSHNELFDRLKNPELNDSELGKKETPQEFRARKDALEGKGKENNGGRIQAQKARVARDKRAKAEKAEAESFENDPKNHAGGAWEKELLPGQQTRSGFQYRG